MGVPRSVTTVRNNGNLEFTSSVDRVEYFIEELSRGALRDTAKLVRKRMLVKIKKLPGMKRNKRVYKVVQTWVRRKETDLQIGFGNSKKGLTGDTWYAIKQELGTRGQPKRGILRQTVYESIPDIRKIQAQYLSAMNDENPNAALIDENDEGDATNG